MIEKHQLWEISLYLSLTDSRKLGHISYIVARLVVDLENDIVLAS